MSAETILAIVEETDEQDADEQAIIENLQRVDITALEEANAYQRMIDRYGYTPEDLAKRLGMAQPWRVSDRLALLTIREDYRDLYAKGHISTAQARQMTKLSPEGQGQLFEAINTGKIPGRAGLLAFTETIRDQERQVAMFEPEPEEERPTEDDKRAVRTFMDPHRTGGRSAPQLHRRERDRRGRQGEPERRRFRRRSGQGDDDRSAAHRGGAAGLRGAAGQHRPAVPQGRIALRPTAYPPGSTGHPPAAGRAAGQITSPRPLDPEARPGFFFAAGALSSRRKSRTNVTA